MRDDRGWCFPRLVDIHDSICERERLSSAVQFNGAGLGTNLSDEFAPAEETLYNAGEVL